jgi:hypothetical protein
MAIRSFVDRDMLMRHFGHGVGHLQYRTQTQLQDSESRTMGEADMISDDDMGREQEHDIGVDIEEEGELEGELDSDVDSDSASTISEDLDESGVSDDSSDNDSDGYASF